MNDAVVNHANQSKEEKEEGNPKSEEPKAAKADEIKNGKSKKKLRTQLTDFVEEDPAQRISPRRILGNGSRHANTRGAFLAGEVGLAG